MNKIDYIDSRVDIVKNIYTLYSYAKSDETEIRKWALQRYKQGKLFVVEKFGDKLLFAPLNFTIYKDNSIEKHSNRKSDRDIVGVFNKLHLYRKIKDDYLSTQFKKFMSELGIEKEDKSFFISININAIELRRKSKCCFIIPTKDNNKEEEVWIYFRDNNTFIISEDETTAVPILNDNNESEIYDDSMAAFRLIKDEDIICCINNNGLYGIGVVLSPYKLKKNIQFASIVNEFKSTNYYHFDVAWLCYNEEGYINVSDLNIRLPETQWQSGKEFIQSDEIPSYISTYLLNKGNINNDKNMEIKNKYVKYTSLLKANKNLILTGAPGTGKTYMAIEIAKAMGAEYEIVQFHPSYDYTDFVEGLRPVKSDNSSSIGFERRDGVFKNFCGRALNSRDKFYNVKKLTPQEAFNIFKDRVRTSTNGLLAIHYRDTDGQFDVYVNENNKIGVKISSGNTQSITDEDIIRSLEKNVHEGHNTYPNCIGQYIKNNIMGYNEQNYSINKVSFIPYVFIIDEINRGEISKIFGELFFSIDPGYRGNKKLRVKTQYQNLITSETDPFYEGFYIPDNIYIIGTMNDIDRSVESMDFAMRRRFAWEEVKANENTGMLDNLGEMKGEVVATMQRVNSVIWDDVTNTGIEGLSTAYHIGGAYFSKLPLYLNEDCTNKNEAYEQLWNNHLKGLLFEYLRGTPDAVENLKKLENAYYKIDTDDIEG